MVTREVTVPKGARVQDYIQPPPGYRLHSLVPRPEIVVRRARALGSEMVSIWADRYLAVFEAE